VATQAAFLFVCTRVELNLVWSPYTSVRSLHTRAQWQQLRARCYL